VTLSAADAALSPLHRRLVFLFAPPRSGAEVVRDALATCPGVRTLAEPTHLFDEALLRIWASSKAPGRDGIGRLVDEDELLPAMRRLADSILASAVPGGERLVEYTPGHATVADVIAKVYPDAWFVAVERDGRAATQELVHGPHKRYRWAVVAARQWADAHRALTRGPTATRVHLETFLSDAERELAALATALDLSVDDEDVTRAAAVVRAGAADYATEPGTVAVAAAEAAATRQLEALGYGGLRSGIGDRVLRRAWRVTLPRGKR
jgi:hypothetical protein